MVDHTDTSPFSPEQARAIAAIGAIGAAQSANALSRLIGVEVKVEPPELITAPISEVPKIFGGMSAPSLGILIPFTGDLEGNNVLIFPEEGISELDALLFPDSHAAEGMRESAFAEIGNILAGTFLTVLSRLSSRVLVNQPPVVVRDMAGAIIDGILAEQGAGSSLVLVLVSRLSDSAGRSLVRAATFPDPGGTELLLEAAGRLLSTP